MKDIERMNGNLDELNEKDGTYAHISKNGRIQLDGHFTVSKLIEVMKIVALDDLSGKHHPGIQI